MDLMFVTTNSSPLVSTFLLWEDLPVVTYNPMTFRLVLWVWEALVTEIRYWKGWNRYVSFLSSYASHMHGRTIFFPAWMQSVECEPVMWLVFHQQRPLFPISNVVAISNPSLYLLPTTPKLWLRAYAEKECAQRAWELSLNLQASVTLRKWHHKASQRQTKMKRVVFFHILTKWLKLATSAGDRS